MPGLARRQVSFFCFAKRKKPKKRRPGFVARALRAGVPLAARVSGPLRNSPSLGTKGVPRPVPEQCSRTAPFHAARLRRLARGSPQFEQLTPSATRAIMLKKHLCCVISAKPVRVAEQRRSRGGGPQAMFEGEHSAYPQRQATPRARVLRAARGSEQHRAARRADEPGAAFFWLLFLARQEK